MTYKTDDVHIKEIKELTPPDEVLRELPITDRAAETTYETREAIHRILQGEDDRLVVVSGPCSIHDPKAAIEYAERLKELREKFSDDLLIIMRVYFEKPRTTVGWKGLINDPYLNDSFQINDGIRIARKLLLDVNEMGVPAGTEFLDMITPQYLNDLISWGAIGARTTESQLHRELASGTSCPIGFKNGTGGSLKIAVDAIRAALKPHHFLSVTKAGRSAIVGTTGNPDCHIILRGGKEPNYDAAHIELAAKELEAGKQPPNIMVDFSHANSNKDYKRQITVAEDIAGQMSAGEKRIFGVMIESNLTAGQQSLKPDGEMVYGQSITDACIDLEDSEKVFTRLAEAVRTRRGKALV